MVNHYKVLSTLFNETCVLFDIKRIRYCVDPLNLLNRPLNRSFILFLRESDCLPISVNNSCVFDMMGICCKFQFFEKVLNPAWKSTLITKFECSLHSLLFLSWCFFDDCLKLFNNCLCQERIEFVKPCKLTAASCEFTQEQSWIFKVFLYVFSKYIFEACKIETVFKSGHEKNISARPES